MTTSTTSNEPQKKKSGFAVLIGRSNVGKSSLLNALVHSKIAITSPKPQTTRFTIHGVVTTNEGQIVFVDTPGIMHIPRDVLSQKLSTTVKHALQDIDAVVYVVDPTRSIGDEEKEVLRMVRSITTIPKILVINKQDEEEKPFQDFYKDLAPEFDACVEVSARTGSHVNQLVQTIMKFMPEGEFNYPEYQITNISNNQWVSELIREKLFLRLRDEVPYSIHVETEEVTKRDNGVTYIRAIILTSEERYRRMIIGKGGRGIKEIGQSTRRELEPLMECPVYLDLHVEVDKHWMERLPA